MRKLALMSLLALPLAVGCNGGGDDTGDSDTDTDTDTEAPSYALASASSTYTRMHGDDTACDFSYDLSGTEYSSADCPDCDFAFLIDATAQGTPSDSVPPCPDADPYPFSFPTFDGQSASYQTGMGYVSSGDLYYSGLLLDASSVFFTFLDVNGLMYYTRLHGGSVYYAGQQFDFSNYGSFTWEGTDFSWTYGVDFDNGVSATQAFCEDVEFDDRTKEVWQTTDYDPEAEDPPTLPTPPDSPAETASGSLSNCTEAMVDSYTVEVADGDTLTAAVDVPSGSAIWDPRLYINTEAGCSLVQADDQFECTAGPCPSGVDENDDNTNTDDTIFECCSVGELTNDSGDTQTYEIFVVATQFICDEQHTDNPPEDPEDRSADYTLEIAGGSNLTANHDDYLPTIDLAFEGSGTLSEN